MAMTGWSTTAADNDLIGAINWQENQAPSTVNDSARATMVDVKAEWYQAADLSSSATTAIGAAIGGYMKILGTTTITAFDTVDKGIRRRIHFGGALILTHGATLILPGGANITTVAGDTAEFISEGSGTWRCLWYGGHPNTLDAKVMYAGTSGAPALSIGGYNAASSAWILGNTNTASIADGAATAICNLTTAVFSGIAFVYGGTAATQFMDIVACSSYADSFAVMVSATLVGTPAARTYTFPGGDDLKLTWTGGGAGAVYATRVLLMRIDRPM
jgi:hypothetical protein